MLGDELLGDARVRDGGLDLRAVADDAGIVHEPLDVALVERRDRVDVEAGERGAERRPPPQDRDPRQPGLEPLEAELLEQRPVAVQRRAPLLVVVARVLGVGADPGAARPAVVADDDRRAAHAAERGFVDGREERVVGAAGAVATGRRRARVCAMPSCASSHDLVGMPSPPL